MRLEHKVAIVTGGGTGIGEAIAKVFAREGAKVAITGRRKDELERGVRDIERKGGQALALPGSVTNEPDVPEAVAATARDVRWGNGDSLRSPTALSTASRSQSPSAARRPSPRRRPSRRIGQSELCLHSGCAPRRCKPPSPRTSHGARRMYGRC